LQGLLEEALELPPLARTAWLESLPSIHEPLREPLRRLLEVHEGLDSRPFIDGFGHGTEGLTPPASVLIGDLVGPYRLMQQIGDGGMGSVWLAERADGSIKRKVALKLPRMVWARDLASRMARERDILGSLEHSRIARLYDAGVDQLGRPFLALEYVEGERIDHHCDEQRHGMAQRIRLFLQVLEAVQHAHINLVLHRDLKPANVLVDQRGEVRLLDFGIAKLLDDDSSPTPADAHSRSLSRAMTPRYASPEQVQQLRLSLASDVYSLGVMLYELLVGATPYVTANGSRAELEIAIVEGHLRLPSRAALDATTANRRQSTPARLARSLRGELDAVLLKALARNPIERYPSAEELRADLTRWLDGHPVRAKRPSSLLALRKFVVRNAWSVAFGSAAACAVIVAALIALMQAREARLESQRAAATRDFLLGLFENANPELHGGRELTARDLLIAGETSLPTRLSREPETSSEVLRVMANAWAQLGNFEKMAELAAQRSAMLRKSGDPILLARALIDEAQVATRAGEARRVDKILDEILASGVESELPTNDRSDLHWVRGFSRLSHGENQSALREFFLARREAEKTRNPSREVSSLYGAMLVHWKSGQRQEAVQTYRTAIDALRSKDMDAGEKLRRSFELAALLFEMGEYKEGWDDIGVLLVDSIALFGMTAASQQPLYLYWLNWTLRMGEIETAERFMLGLKQGGAIPTAASGSALDLEWSLTEARLDISRRRYRDAATVLSRLIARQSGENQRRSIGLLEAELFIRWGKPSDAIRIFDRLEWTRLSDNRANDPGDWGFYRNWILGSALDSAGRTDAAVKHLLDAERQATARFGDTHPRTALVTIGHLVADINRDPNFVPSPEFFQSLEGAVSVLRRAYPARNEYLLSALRLAEVSKRGDYGQMKNVAKSISRSAPFL
jgi:serine/threonine protein kinase